MTCAFEAEEPAVSEAKSGKKSRLLWGCVGGCLGIVVLVLVLIGVGVWWAVGAVPVVPPETFVKEESVGFGIVEMREDDSAMKRFVARTLQEPALARGAQQETVRAEQLGSLAPLQGVLIVSQDGGRRLSVGGVISVGRFSRPLGKILAGQTPATGEYKRTTIHARGRRFLGIRKNNFMWGASEEHIREWTDRLVKQRGAKTSTAEIAPSGVLQEAYDRTEKSHPVRFAWLNESGQLRHFLERFEESVPAKTLLDAGIASESVLSLAGDAHPMNEEDVALTFWIQCSDAEKAGTVRDGLLGATGSVQETFGVQEVQAELVGGNIVEVRGTFRGVPQKIARLAERLQAGAGARRQFGGPGPE